MINANEITVKWLDVKDAFVSVVEKGEPTPAIWGSTIHVRRLKGYALDPNFDDDFVGGTPAQTCNWIKKGFTTDAFRNAGRYVEASTKKRRRFNEWDGTLDYDRMMSGETAFFSKREKRPTRPGITVNVTFTFAAFAKASTIADYGAWVAGFIGALEKQGIDLCVNVRSRVDNLYRGQSGRSVIDFRVKEYGERSRFSAWSVLFAPTGYRSLIFTGYHVAGEQIGLTPNSGLGRPIQGQTWAVAYDTENNVVDIDCFPQAAGEHAFPADQMTGYAKAAGLL